MTPTVAAGNIPGWLLRPGSPTAGLVSQPSNLCTRKPWRGGPFSYGNHKRRDSKCGGQNRVYKFSGDPVPETRLEGLSQVQRLPSRLRLGCSDQLTRPPLACVHHSCLNLPPLAPRSIAKLACFALRPPEALLKSKAQITS